MDLDLFFPRRRHYWDPLDWPQRRSHFDSWDPFDNFWSPSLTFTDPRQWKRTVKNIGTSEVVNDPNKFEVKLDCSHFRPEEIEVKTIDNSIVIHGKHEEKMDKHGWVSREFTRRYTLPTECEANEVISSLSPQGVLRIEAPKKALEAIEDNERVVPIKVIHEYNDSNDSQNAIQN